jgi:hypothetical protein
MTDFISLSQPGAGLRYVGFAAICKLLLVIREQHESPFKLLKLTPLLRRTRSPPLLSLKATSVGDAVTVVTPSRCHMV